MKASDGVDVGEHIVAEAALEMALISGDEVCGGNFYGTVMTRSSAAGEMSPDLKDLAGPFAMDMEVLTPHATLQPDCDGNVYYDGWIDEDEDIVCDWTLTDGTTTYEVDDSCSGTVYVGPGDWTAELTVTDLDSSCAAAVTTEPVEVGETLSVDPWATATCDTSFDYGATIDGDSGTTSVHWDFYDSSGWVGESWSLTGSFDAGYADAYRAELSVEDQRADGLICSAEGEAPVDVYGPLEVVATLTGTCAESFDYSVTVDGGTGGHSVSWAFSDGSTSTSASGSVAVGTQPTGGAAYSGTVSVLDVRPDALECSGEGADSTQVYSPVTVSIEAGAVGIECEAVESSDAVTWTPTIHGGTGDFSYDWTVAACGSDTTCTVDPADAEQCYDVDVQLTVGDRGICEDASSETETYTKYTVVEVAGL